MVAKKKLFTKNKTSSDDGYSLDPNTGETYKRIQSILKTNPLFSSKTSDLQGNHSPTLRAPKP
jgi:hypothetical protein